MNFETFLGDIAMNLNVIGAQSEQNKTNFNVMFRILYEKGLFTDSDILESFKKEYTTLYELGAIKQVPNDEMMEVFKDNVVMWLKADPNEIKRKMEEMSEIVEKNHNENSSKIDVVGADALNMLNNASKSNGKLII